MKNELTASDYEAILGVMNHFDASKVAKAMKALNWYWGSVDDVPEWWDINTKATEMLKEVALAATTRGITHFSGGLWARGVIENDKLLLELKFVLEESDNYEW